MPPLLGAVRPDRNCDPLRDLRGSSRGVPNLHARRCRMRHGAATAWIGATSFSKFVGWAKAHLRRAHHNDCVDARWWPRLAHPTLPTLRRDDVRPRELVK